MSLKTLRNLLFFLSLLIFSFGGGYRLGLNDALKASSLFRVEFVKKSPPPTIKVDFSLFWEAWERLSQSYIDKKNLQPQKMLYGAISGLVSSLGDPYTVFLTPEQNQEAKDDLGGRFQGIGAQLGVKEKKIVVVAPLKGTPAERAGLRPGDWIVKVDGKETLNWTLPEAVSKIRGEKGSKVVLTIMHKEASQSTEVAIIREEIKVPSVEWEVKTARKKDGGWEVLGAEENCESCPQFIYLRLSRFGDETSREWLLAVEEIEKKLFQDKSKKIRGMVFDVRNNPGGYLSGSVFIASEFLEKGIVVIQENGAGMRQSYSVNRRGKLLALPLVVLINKGTASASEIVAGALREQKRAKLVGEATFGKGTIQEAQDLSGGTGMHITTAKWLLPSGRWVNGGGLEPDLKVEINPQEEEEKDLQLEKAVEVLLK